MYTLSDNAKYMIARPVLSKVQWFKYKKGRNDFTIKLLYKKTASGPWKDLKSLFEKNIATKVVMYAVQHPEMEIKGPTAPLLNGWGWEVARKGSFIKSSGG